MDEGAAVIMVGQDLPYVLSRHFLGQQLAEERNHDFHTAVIIIDNGRKNRFLRQMADGDDFRQVFVLLDQAVLTRCI